MSREIKFRAWDKKAQRHYDWNFLAIASNNGKFSPWCISGEGLTIRVDCEDYIIEQFTGLHDKNWNEIYEGDIIKIAPDFLFEVKWCQNNASFIAGVSQHLSGAELSEIIGNIHQNPELLENKNG